MPEPDTHPVPDRRRFIALGVGALVVAGVPWLGRTRRRLFRRTLPVMGTTAEIAVVHGDPLYAEAAIEAAFQRIRQVETLLTRFMDGSDIGRANRQAASAPVLVTRETFTVLRASLEWAEMTDGAFDPCIGRAVALWDPVSRSVPPDPGAVTRLASRGLYKALDVDHARGRPAVRFTDRDVAIDLGGIGKGYGVDEAVRTLRDWGIRDALVNAGGDLYAMGVSENGDAWRIGIRSPHRPDRTVATVAVEESAVATSGDYLRYFEHGARRYHHIIDPATGAPREGSMRSLTVRAANCMTADAAATAAFGKGAETARRIARRGGAEVVNII